MQGPQWPKRAKGMNGRSSKVENRSNDVLFSPFFIDGTKNSSKKCHPAQHFLKKDD